MSRYRQVEEGEWLPVKKRGEKVMCCGCGLVHVHDFRIVDDRIEERSVIDLRATAAARKSGKYRQP